MENFSDWLLAIFTALLAAIGISYKVDKKRLDDSAKECVVRDTLLAERLARVETALMSERDVRKVLKEHFDPIVVSMADVNKNVQEIKIQLASLPKRKEDGTS